MKPPEPRRRRLSIAAVVVLAALLFVVGAVVTRGNGGPGSWQPDGAEIQKAVATAQAAAREAHPATVRDVSPTGWPAYVTGVRLIGTDRQTALDAMGTPGAASDNPPVILVEISGTFGGGGFSGPSNAAIASIHGSYLQLALDPHSGQGYDAGIVSYEMDLEWYSTPITVYPEPASG